MGDQIGIDPVERDALVQQFIDEHKSSFDALMPEAKDAFRKALGDLTESWTRLLDEERRKTIDHVLLIIKQVERIQGPMQYLKETLICFRDDKPPPSPPGRRDRDILERT